MEVLVVVFGLRKPTMSCGGRASSMVHCWRTVASLGPDREDQTSCAIRAPPGIGSFLIVDLAHLSSMTKSNLSFSIPLRSHSQQGPLLAGSDRVSHSTKRHTTGVSYLLHSKGNLFP